MEVSRNVMKDDETVKWQYTNKWSCQYHQQEWRLSKTLNIFCSSETPESVPKTLKSISEIHQWFISGGLRRTSHRAAWQDMRIFVGQWESRNASTAATSMWVCMHCNKKCWHFIRMFNPIFLGSIPASDFNLTHQNVSHLSNVCLTYFLSDEAVFATMGGMVPCARSRALRQGTKWE